MVRTVTMASIIASKVKIKVLKYVGIYFISAHESLQQLKYTSQSSKILDLLRPLQLILKTF